jgi:protein involved in polysaccharide export with SLBB domain
MVCHHISPRGRGLWWVGGDVLMNWAWLDKWGRMTLTLLVVALAMVSTLLTSGCATPANDDYVQQIIAEAMADSRPAEYSAPAVAPAVEAAPLPEPVRAASAADPVPAPTADPVNPLAAETSSKPEAQAPTTVKLTTPTIQPETLLWVTVSEDPSLNGRYLVNGASAIDFGYVGLVFLADMNVEQAEATIRNVLEGRYLNKATVSVKIAKASYDQVAVLGAVDMPSPIKIGAGATITLNEALRRAGGLRGNRDNARVKIIRGGMRTAFGPAAPGDVHVLSSADGRLQVPEILLRNNDMAYVFTYETAQPGSVSGGKRILLLGEVPRRGVVDFAENEPCTVMYLLFKIGGLPRFARADRIQVVRTAKDGSEKTFLVNGSDLMSVGDPRNDLVLESGDRVIVRARRFAFF